MPQKLPNIWAYRFKNYCQDLSKSGLTDYSQIVLVKMPQM